MAADIGFDLGASIPSLRRGWQRVLDAMRDWAINVSRRDRGDQPPLEWIGDRIDHTVRELMAVSPAPAIARPQVNGGDGHAARSAANSVSTPSITPIPSASSSRALPYAPELETLGQRYSVHRGVGETETAYGHRVIAAIVAAHDRNAAVTALVERDLDLAVQIVAQRHVANQRP